MDTFYEQIVKRNTPGRTKIAYYIVLCFACFTALGTLFLNFIVFGIPFIACIIIVAMLATDINVEYEYAYTNGDLQIDKIISGKRRRKVVDVDLDTIQQICPATSPALQGVYLKKPKIYQCTSLKTDARLYTIVARDKNGNNLCVIFEPNDDILNDYRRRIPRIVTL